MAKYNYEDLHTLPQLALKDRIPDYREPAVFALQDERGAAWIADGLNLTRDLVRADKAVAFAAGNQRAVAETYTEIPASVLAAAQEGRQFEAVILCCCPCEIETSLLHTIRDAFISHYRERGFTIYS